MSRRQKREHKKRDDARLQRARIRNPQSKIQNGAAALVAAGAIAAGTSAYAAPIRFDNPAHGDAGHFHWGDGERLNLLLAAADNPELGQVGGSAFSQADFGIISTIGGNVAHVQSVITQAAGYYGIIDLPLIADVGVGTMIPDASLSWDSDTPYQGLINDGYYGLGSLLPESQLVYLGTRFEAPDDGNFDFQYGWIAGVRTGFHFEATAWGYEADHGVPVAAGAPEPGSLALLAFGAAAFAKRRRTVAAMN